MRKLILMSLALLSSIVAVRPVWAQDGTKPRLDIVVGRQVEDGETILLATVRRASKPVEGAVVGFYVTRTFGLLPLGEEETLDDGTAAVPFPVNLPGGTDGRLQVVAKVAAAAGHAESRGTAVVSGGTVVLPHDDPFPRALWSPRAPLGLILTIGLLLVFVWGTFAVVVLRLRRIRQLAVPPGP